MRLETRAGTSGACYSLCCIFMLLGPFSISGWVLVEKLLVKWAAELMYVLGIVVFSIVSV